jgi:hypothetical protein
MSYSPFYGIRNFITMLTSLPLDPIMHQLYFTKIHFNIILQSTPIFPKWTFLFKLSKTFYIYFTSPRVAHATSNSSSLKWSRNKLLWKLQNIYPSKYFPRHFVLKQPKSIGICFRQVSETLYSLVFFKIGDDGQSKKKKLIPTVIHIRHNPLESILHLSYCFILDIKHHTHIKTKLKSIHCLLLTKFHNLEYNVV